MKNRVPWFVAGMLLVVIILQVIVIRKMPGEAEVPSLKEIEQKIMHWTMHHGSVFSASTQVSALEGKMDTRLSAIEEQLQLLSKKHD